MLSREESVLGVVVGVVPPGTLQTDVNGIIAAAAVSNIETVVSVAAMRERIRDGCRDSESDVVVGVVGADVLAAAGEYDRRATLALAHEAGTGIVVVTDDGAGEYPATLSDDKGAASVLGVLTGRIPESARGAQLATFAKMQIERRRQRLRERELESQLAGLRVMESRLQYMVYHDELTGLANRRRLKEAIELSLLRAVNLNRQCSLILLDVDRFKLVNDIEGYDAGDRMLVEIAGIVRRYCGDSDTAARIGSDEFVLLLDNCGAEKAADRADRLQHELEGYRFHRGQRSYRTCTSIGVATANGVERSASPSELLARADQACFIAKRQGRNRVEYYSDTHPELAQFRLDHGLAPIIRDAVEHDRLFFCFQPIVRVLDGKLTHYECLLRMRDPDGKLHMPGEFIPVAERTGLIHHIDLWVVDKAMDFLAELPSELGDVSVSVNLSAHAFHNHALLDLVTRRLELGWVAPSRLVMEITETAAIENLEACRHTIARLRALGCRFALDDFGSGFSTFHYIKHFPVDYLKLDGSFIRNLLRDTTDQALVRHMIAIARSMRKQTIAEFVESREIYDMLAGMGVDYVQGHYIGRASEQPVSSVELPTPRVHRNGEAEAYSPLLDRLWPTVSDAGSDYRG